MLDKLKPFIEEIDEELDVDLEIPHIAYIEAKKPNPKILLFKNPISKKDNKKYNYPVLMNLFANDEVLKVIFGDDVNNIAKKIENALKIKPPKTFMDKIEMLKFAFNLKNVFPKRLNKKGKCQEIELDSLDDIPILKTWSEDGGRFITMGQVYTHSLDGEINNVGMYRLQKYDSHTLGMHWQIHKDSNHLFHEYKKAKQKMPVTIAIGGDPLYTWAATAPMPHGVFELLLYGFIRNKNPKLVKSLTNDIYIPEDADFVIEGYVDTEHLREEGMFGDHTGYYTLKELYPYLEVTKITAKKDAIYYATVVGKPPLEDKYMGYATERIFLPLLQTQTPDLIDYHMPENGVFHNLILGKLSPKYPGHYLQIIHALWGVGQMSFVKHAIFVDENAPSLTDYENLTKYILDRFDKNNIFISEGIVDALDHSAIKKLVGGKIAIYVEDKINPRHLDILDDEKLFEILKVLDSSILDIKQYFTDTNNPILVIKYEKIKPAKEIFEKIKSLKEHLSIVVFIDHHNDNDVNNPYMIVWRVVNNIDAKRDIFIDDIIGIDGTNKSQIDGFDREWPPDVVCDLEVLYSLKKRNLIDIDEEFIKKYQLL